MKSSHLSLAQLISCLAILLSAQSSVGQAIHCGTGSEYVGGPINVVDLIDRLEISCNEAPSDHNITQAASPGYRAICKDGAPLVYGPQRAYTSGTDACTAYGKKLVVEFEQPVADLRMGIYGARTATDNRGFTVQLSPYPGSLAFFPGGGITKVTITNPHEFDAYYPNGALYAHGAWEIVSYGTNWVWDSSYQECNCNRPTFTRPAPSSYRSANAIDSG